MGGCLRCMGMNMAVSEVHRGCELCVACVVCLSSIVWICVKFEYVQVRLRSVDLSEVCVVCV